MKKFLIIYLTFACVAATYVWLNHPYINPGEANPCDSWLYCFGAVCILTGIACVTLGTFIAPFVYPILAIGLYSKHSQSREGYYRDCRNGVRK